MVLFSFSIPRMIPDILSGKKAQTTRIPRKPRKNGAKPYSVGELGQLYYKSRMAHDFCKNCLVSSCPHGQKPRISNGGCTYPWTNFFGKSDIIGINHYTKADHLEMCEQTHTALLGNEMWAGVHIGELKESEVNAWAIADGFPEGINEAHEFFVKSTGDEEWMFKDLDVIKWNGTQIARRVA